MNLKKRSEVASSNDFLSFLCWRHIIIYQVCALKRRKEKGCQVCWPNDKTCRKTVQRTECLPYNPNKLKVVPIQTLLCWNLEFILFCDERFPLFSCLVSIVARSHFLSRTYIHSSLLFESTITVRLYLGS